MATDLDEVDGPLLDGGAILTCTAATLDLLRRALAAELGVDDAADYGLDPDLRR